jgi:hypothetical protein
MRGVLAAQSRAVQEQPAQLRNDPLQPVRHAFYAGTPPNLGTDAFKPIIEQMRAVQEKQAAEQSKPSVERA